MKVLIVGGGVTSALTGLCIRKMLPNCNLSMWDKARGAGGRMTTNRCNLNARCTADIGAQYITTTEDFIKSNGDIYDDLLSEGIIQPLKCKIIGMKPQGNNINYVVPEGTGSLVKYFFNRANLNETKFSHHVSSINKEQNKWIVETNTGEKEDFDLVILTIPVPQLFLLRGNLMHDVSSETVNNLKTVNYSSRFVLVLYFFTKLDENWGAKYLDNDPVFRYVAIDNIKRNHESDDNFSVVFHTTVKFGQDHVDETLSDIEKVLLAEARNLFPDWPQPTSTKCHKWRYSQVTNAYPGTPGCLIISHTPPLVIGGDGFVGSTFDNCVISSKTISEKVKEMLKIP